MSDPFSIWSMCITGSLRKLLALSQSAVFRLASRTWPSKSVLRGPGIGGKYFIHLWRMNFHDDRSIAALPTFQWLLHSSALGCFCAPCPVSCAVLSFEVCVRFGCAMHRFLLLLKPRNRAIQIGVVPVVTVIVMLLVVSLCALFFFFSI